MLKNIILTSIRSLMKNKTTFLLNLLALAIGISACMAAYLHIDYELSFDQFHSKKDRVYRVVTGNVATGNGWVKVSAPIAPKIQSELPEVESFARLTKFSYNPKVAVKYGQQVYNEANVYLADPALFSIFDFEIIAGRASVNPAPNTVLISEEVAAKYGSDEALIGEKITIDGRMDFSIAGIFKKLNSNSHFDLDFVVPFENLEAAKPGTSLSGNWGQFNYFTYILLREGADARQAGLKLTEILVEYGDNESLKFENLRLQALADIHFQANRGNLKPAYNTRYLQIYSGIALAVLVISFINFINLNIASSMKRIKEVGVRKVLGASRPQLILQFVSESTITATLSSMLAVILTVIVLPYINDIIESNMVLNLADPVLISGIILLIISIALFSGLYISMFMLSFSPINAVKGAVKIGNKGKRFKEMLLTTQFAVSCILILCSVFIYRQLNFMRNQDIGLDQNGIITLQLYDQKSQQNAKPLIDEIQGIAGVEHISASSFTPGAANWHQTIDWDNQMEEVSWNLIIGDKHFIETFGIDLSEGDIENIKAISDGERDTYVINEAALASTGWEQGLGKAISPFGKDRKSPIAGVVKDFNYKSLHNAVEPCVLVISNDRNYSQVSIKFSTDDVFSMVSDIEGVFNDVLPQTPFEYSFADDAFDRLYKVEQQTSQLVGLLTGIAVLLAMMGVYSLLSYTIKERTKEIAIRKVLGIKMQETMYILSRDYLRLLIIGNVIGIPVTWYLMAGWLQNFSYQITLSFVTFAAVALATFLIIVIVAGLKVFQIEKINPAEALHYE
ncbi:MAG: FtsX-like permease family protein [Cyclobacteriaceae bacterium]